MPDLTIPLIATTVFVGVGWLIINAGQTYDDAIGHTLKIFALVLGLLVMAGMTAKLRAGLGVNRLNHRVEARSQTEATDTNRRGLGTRTAR
jgi:hypothetical protein